MKRIKVSSSMINSIGYDSISRILEVEFNDKSVYQYYSIPQNIYNEIMKATSHGKYFHRYIRNRYKYKKVK